MRTTALVWHVYIATARKEFRVADALRVLGGEAFVPHVMRKARKELVPLALVPKYVFAGFPIVPWLELEDVKHLQGAVTFDGENPARMTARDIAKARSMAEPPLAKIAPLRPGDRVKIKSGPFAELAGIIEDMLEGTAVLDIAKAGRVTIDRNELEAA